MDPRISQLIAVSRLHDQTRAAAAVKDAKAVKREQSQAQPAARGRRFVRRSRPSTTPTR